MNQGKSGDAQKSFEQALAADPNFAQARMNLGISLLGQQKLEQARAALEAASNKLPDDPYAWYNLGLAYKDLALPEKAIATFQHVEKIAPDEPDAFYFEGFLLSQLQKYDEAIAAFKKALEIAPYHASAQFGLARAYQRKGDTEAAREGMKKFPEDHFRASGNAVWSGVWGSREILPGGIRARGRQHGTGRNSCALWGETSDGSSAGRAVGFACSITMAMASRICFSWQQGEERASC